MIVSTLIALPRPSCCCAVRECDGVDVEHDRLVSDRRRLRRERDQVVEHAQHIHDRDEGDEAEHAADRRDDHVQVRLQRARAVDGRGLAQLDGHSLEPGQDDEHRERQHVPHGVGDDEDRVGHLLGEPEHLRAAHQPDEAIEDAAEVVVDEPGERHGAHQVRQHVRDEQDAEDERTRQREAVHARGDDVAQHEQDRGGDDRHDDGEQRGLAESRVGERVDEVVESDERAGRAVVDLLEAPLDGADEGDDQESAHHQEAGCEQQPEFACLHRFNSLRRTVAWTGVQATVMDRWISEVGVSRRWPRRRPASAPCRPRPRCCPR